MRRLGGLAAIESASYTDEWLIRWAMPAIAVHQLHLATVQRPRKIDVFAYLICHPDGLFLVDTGIGTGHALVDQRFSPERRSLEEAIATIGAGARDISAVINSHLHFDHCGNNRLFGGIPTYIHRRDFEAAQAPGYTVQEWFDFDGARIELIDGDRELATGVTLIASPGHTPGHQSVIIESHRMLTLIAAQVAFTAHEFRAGGNIAEAHEGFAETYLSTIAHLKSLGPAEAYFSHDRAPWRP